MPTTRHTYYRKFKEKYIKNVFVAQRLRRPAVSYLLTGRSEVRVLPLTISFFFLFMSKLAKITLNNNNKTDNYIDYSHSSFCELYFDGNTLYMTIDYLFSPSTEHLWIKPLLIQRA